MRSQNQNLTCLVTLSVLFFASSLTSQPHRFETRGDPSSLRDWAQEKGVTFADGVGFSPARNTEGMKNDWQIVPLENTSNNMKLEKGSVLLSVPKELVLNSVAIEKEMEGSPLRKALKTLGKRKFTEHKGEFLIFLKILKEVGKGESSQWFDWIQCLPPTFSTGVCFDDVELDCLPSFSRALADNERKKLKIFSKCAKLAENVWENDNIHAGHDSDWLFQWAYNVVYTRCWKFSDELDSGATEIVPMGDLFNHKEPANVAVESDSSSTTANFVLQSDGATDFSLSYGLATNAHRFLVVFGFVDETMPEIFCQVVFPEATPEQVLLGCQDRSKMCYSQDGAISDTVFDSVLYLLLASKPEEQRALYDAHLQGDGESKKLLRYKYSLEISLTLKNHVDGTLQELESLLKSIEEASVGSHPNLPLIKRQNIFLQGVFRKVSEVLADMVQEETLRRRSAATTQ